MVYWHTQIVVLNWHWLVGKKSLKSKVEFRKLLFWGMVQGCFNTADIEFWKDQTKGAAFMD